MAIVVVGIHERNAALELFERVALSGDDLRKALAHLTDSPNLNEVVAVSTCLRTEIYAVVERFHDGLSDIESWLRGRLGDGALGPGGLAIGDQRVEPGGGVVDLGSQFSCWYDEAAVAHLFEVAAGIDSPVLGEGEVLRQVREAAEVAREEGAAGAVLGAVFRHAIEAGKRVRTETDIQRGTASLAHGVVEVAADRALGLDGRRVLVVGAGEMGAGIVRALSGRSDLTGEVTVVNRDPERAGAVADLAAGRAAGLADLDDEILRADVVITSTAAGGVVVSRERLAALLARRPVHAPSRPLVVVDAAVPRNVEAGVASLEGVVLADIEDVRRHAEEQLDSRRSELPKVRALLAEELERYRTTATGRLVAPVVSALRDRAEALRAAELARHRHRLEEMDPGDRALVETVTRRVVAKMLHEPTVRVKDAAGSPRGERLAEALRTLFDL